MEKVLMFLLILVAMITSNLAQGLATPLSPNEKLIIKRQLERINKPATRSFMTKHGDLMDCVEIDKQLAFDHPLLRNHSIQMRPTFKISRRAQLNDSSSLILTASHLIPKNMRCPEGTVLIKRIQEGDLAMSKFKKVFAHQTSKSSYILINGSWRDEMSILETSTQNTGAAGMINLWNPAVTPNQFSDIAFYVEKDDGDIPNGIMTGWTKNPRINADFIRLFGYWTRDGSLTTGCYNTQCPGFVQTSQQVTLGQILSPISTHLGKQYFVDLTIQQDAKTKNWWLFFEKEQVGYWPKELFTSLANGANKAGWGGEIMTPVNETTPGMGSGHFAKENYTRACLVKWLQLFTPQGFPSEKELNYRVTKPECYDIVYGQYPREEDEVPEGDWGHFIFVGGPPDCKA